VGFAERPRAAGGHELARPYERVPSYGAERCDDHADQGDRVEAAHERVVRGVGHVVLGGGRHGLQGAPGPARRHSPREFVDVRERGSAREERGERRLDF
jgi:hypothetical protein